MERPNDFGTRPSDSVIPVARDSWRRNVSGQPEDKSKNGDRGNDSRAGQPGLSPRRCRHGCPRRPFLQEMDAATALPGVQLGPQGVDPGHVAAGKPPHREASGSFPALHCPHVAKGGNTRQCHVRRLLPVSEACKRC